MPLFLISLVIVGGFLAFNEKEAKPLGFADVLPKGFELSRPLHSATWEVRGPTIEEKLLELGASVENGKLVDRNGKDIIFAHVESFGWGGMQMSIWEGHDKAPKYLSSKRDGSLEMRRQMRELEAKYTVIVTSQAYK